MDLFRRTFQQSRQPRSTIALIGDPTDPTGLMYQTVAAKRHVDTMWVGIEDALRQCRHRSGLGTLFDCALVDPFASDVIADEFELHPQASLRRAHGVLHVALEYSAYTSVLARILDGAGVLQPNPVASIDISESKWLTYQLMESAGIATPRAVCINTLDEGHQAIERLGFPLVVKDLHSAGGTGVRLVESIAEFDAAAAELQVGKHQLIVQHYIECDSADKRVVVINGEITDAMERRARPGDFRSNLAQGGTGTLRPVADDEVMLVRRAVDAFDLKFVGLDVARVSKVLPGREYLKLGEVFCFEMNAFPGLKGHYGCPEKVVDTMIRQITEHRCNAQSHGARAVPPRHAPHA